MSSARPVRRLDGYLPIDEHGLIGDGRGWALAGRDGVISWMCVPGASSPPLFGRLRDRHGGGEFLLAPEQLTASRQYYLADTGVLVTEMRCPTGLVEVTDLFTLHSGADLTEDAPVGRGELLRYVRVLEGCAALHISVRPRGEVEVNRHGGGLRLYRRSPGMELHLLANRPLPGLRATVPVDANDDLWLLLRWEPRTRRVHHVQPHRLLQDTAAAWRRWSAGITYDGQRADLVRRSALALKLLDHGDRIRDAACTVGALRRIGLPTEADSILSRVLDAAEDRDTPEVRHDGYGEILDCAFQWATHGGAVDDVLWARLAALAEAASRVWRQSDRPATYPVALCQVALDRAARLATRLHLPGATAEWSAQAAAITARILREAWNEGQHSLTDHLGPWGALDARLLALPLRRVVAADHPYMVATARAVADRLGAGDGLLYRFPPEHRAQQQGAFLPYSFWLVHNLLGQGSIDAAGELYDALCARANPLGLLPERIDPVSESFLGDFPYAPSHVGVISSGVALTRALHRGRPELSLHMPTRSPP